MSKRQLPERSFWSSKLGLAACTSIAAMVAMVIVTAHIDMDQALAAPLAFPLADTVVIAGLA